MTYDDIFADTPDNQFFKQILHRVMKEELDPTDTNRAFTAILNGNVSPIMTTAFLLALNMRGEQIQEIQCASSVMKKHALKISSPVGSIDIVGTGGDGKNTLNISTASALVTASTGVPVAKHGNRASSSKCGSADLLAGYGVKIDCNPKTTEEAIKHIGFGFMMAPLFHPSMKNVAKVRGMMGIRTIFNLLGPLTNPADVKYLLMGIFSSDWQLPIAQVLGKGDIKRAWIVHGEDGTDELSATGATHVIEVKDGYISRFDVTPYDAGLTPVSEEDLHGGSIDDNVNALRELLMGKHSAFRTAVLFNVSAALLISGVTHNLKDGVKIAEHAIDSGKAYKVLHKLTEYTNSDPYATVGNMEVKN